MRSIKLSIIVPVYNVELYIEKCILSLENQNISKSDYEIIAVNDGSQDLSVEMIKKLQNSFENIRLISKDNGGLSSSRNAGIKNAIGEYIWFVDSDDYIDANVLNDILSKAYNEDLDFLGFGHKEIFIETNKQKNYSCPNPNTVIDNIKYLSKYPINISSCFHIAKRNIYINNQILFTEGLLHEDYEFMLRFYQFCKRINFINLSPYNYIIKKEGTITTNRNYSHYLKRLDSWIQIINNLTNHFNTQVNATPYAYHARRWINVFKFHTLSTLILLPLNMNDKLKYYHLYLENNCFPKGKAYKLNFRRIALYSIFSIPQLYKISIYFFNLIRIRQ